MTNADSQRETAAEYLRAAAAKVRAGSEHGDYGAWDIAGKELVEALSDWLDDVAFLGPENLMSMHRPALAVAAAVLGRSWPPDA